MVVDAYILFGVALLGLLLMAFLSCFAAAAAGVLLGLPYVFLAAVRAVRRRLCPPGGSSPDDAAHWPSAGGERG